MATQLRDLDIDLITRGHLERGLETLRAELAGTFSGETVERYMAESLEALGAKGATLNKSTRLGSAAMTGLSLTRAAVTSGSMSALMSSRCRSSGWTSVQPRSGLMRRSATAA